MKVLPSLSIFALLTSQALADAPNIVVDIAPLHSLTAMVMEGVGQPQLLLPAHASPHDFALRPSDAQMLNDADLMIWMGEGLTPWLEAPLANLLEGEQLEILATTSWEPRHYEAEHTDDSSYTSEHHGDDHHGHDHHAHDHHAHDHSAHGDEDHDEHHHDGIDPHGWLDPHNAQIWVEDIAMKLAEIDPENSAHYAANALQAQAQLEALEHRIMEQLATAEGDYILSHDAYGYFTARFGIRDALSISDGSSTVPGPRQISTLRDHIQAHDVSCVFSDPEINQEWAQLVTEGTDIPVIRLDPIGQTLANGPSHYAQLISQMADQFATCLKP